MTVLVDVPIDAERLGGETLTFTLDIKTTVLELKEKLAEKVGVAASKQKLKSEVNQIFFKDNHSLGYYNVSDHTTLSLGVKTRGGKK